MSKKRIKVILKFIKDFLDSRQIKTDRLILFGSYARKTQTKDSDIDIAVVSRDFENKNIFKRSQMLTGLDWILVKEFKLPFDIIPLSLKEWKDSPLSQDMIVDYH